MSAIPTVSHTASAANATRPKLRTMGHSHYPRDRWTESLARRVEHFKNKTEIKAVRWPQPACAIVCAPIVRDEEGQHETGVVARRVCLPSLFRPGRSRCQR